jgi:hypothetical protein
MVRKLIDEYAADETGQADYALEANGKLKKKTLKINLCKLIF